MSEYSDRISHFGNRLVVGASPHWDVRSQCLYYVDLLGECFYKYEPIAEEVRCCVLAEGTGAVSFVLPVDNTDDKFIISAGQKLSVIAWDQYSCMPSSVDNIIEVDCQDRAKANRFASGKCDPFGRIYAGTMSLELGPLNVERDLGSLYLFNLRNRNAKAVIPRISTANGLSWCVKRKKMYFLDSTLHTIDEFDYDPSTGMINNRHTVFDFGHYNIQGIPNGMCIDRRGVLYIGMYNAGTIVAIDPVDKKLLKQILIPAHQPTGLAFGGTNLTTLYVTTSSVETEKNNPKAGLVYKITDLGQGAAASNVKLDIPRFQR